MYLRGQKNIKIAYIIKKRGPYEASHFIDFVSEISCNPSNKEIIGYFRFIRSNHSKKNTTNSQISMIITKELLNIITVNKKLSKARICSKILKLMNDHHENLRPLKKKSFWLP